jgi:hypothetical protein
MPPSANVSMISTSGQPKSKSVLDVIKASANIDRRNEKFRRISCSTLAKLLAVLLIYL